MSLLGTALFWAGTIALVGYGFACLVELAHYHRTRCSVLDCVATATTEAPVWGDDDGQSYPVCDYHHRHISSYWHED